jgi:DNA-directed RNA polymerase sigma subunit (sigma70/sigma32)
METDILSDYLKSLYSINPLSTEEEHLLANRIQQGDKEALDKLIKHNLRFVVYLSRQMTAWNRSNIPVEDIVAIGNEALFKAALRWRPKNNSRFATYAKPFILKGVRRELDNTANMIRLPVNIMESLKRLKYNERTLCQMLGREPNNNELAIIMGVKEQKIVNLKNYFANEPVSIDNLNTERAMDDTDD